MFCFYELTNVLNTLLGINTVIFEYIIPDKVYLFEEKYLIIDTKIEVVLSKKLQIFATILRGNLDYNIFIPNISVSMYLRKNSFWYRIISYLKYIFETRLGFLLSEDLSLFPQQFQQSIFCYRLSCQK